MDREQLAASPITALELGYLFELGRTKGPADTVIDDLRARLGLVVADVSMLAICDAATALTWTRDPFDRLLAAHATVSNLPLITNDATIRRHLPLAWWTD